MLKYGFAGAYPWSFSGHLYHLCYIKIPSTDMGIWDSRALSERCGLKEVDQKIQMGADLTVSLQPIKLPRSEICNTCDRT